MKKWIVGIMLAAAFSVLAGSVGLPAERIALPIMEGDFLVCVWDETAEAWMQDHVTYDNSGTYELLIPEWDKWYYIGLWDLANKEYVFGKWIVHEKTD